VADRTLSPASKRGTPVMSSWSYSVSSRWDFAHYAGVPASTSHAKVVSVKHARDLAVIVPWGTG
jgi:hypothetical protein